MRIGSLFSGIGGLELGLEACGAGRVVWQAENDPAALAVLAAHWPTARRYKDVREIDARAARVDVICGGFPCQDVSAAGRGAGLSGARSGLWWEFRRIVRTLRPSFVFIENVSSGAKRWLPVVRRSLWRIGYACLPIRVSASDVGAPHRRARIFVLAYPVGKQLRNEPGRIGWEDGKGSPVASDDGGTRAVAHADGEGELQSGGSERAERGRPCNGGEPLAHAEGIGGALRAAEGERPGRPASGDRWWSVEPDVGRVAHGVPARLDRLRLLGNAVVPQAAALAWQTLYAMSRPPTNQEPTNR